MAVLVPTQSAVNKVSGIEASATLGETVVAGDVLYIDTSAGNVLKKASNAAQATSVVAGIALNTAWNPQSCHYQTSGVIDIGTTVAVGEIYVLFTSGDIAPVADIGTSEYISIIGVGKSATDIALVFFSPEISTPA